MLSSQQRKETVLFRHAREGCQPIALLGTTHGVRDPPAAAVTRAAAPLLSASRRGWPPARGIWAHRKQQKPCKEEPKSPPTSSQHKPTERTKSTPPNYSTSFFLSRCCMCIQEPLPQQKQRVEACLQHDIQAGFSSEKTQPVKWLQICVFVLEIKALIFDAKHSEYWWACSQKRFWSYLSTQNCAI